MGDVREKRVEEIRARLAAATRGPWSAPTDDADALYGEGGAAYVGSLCAREEDESLIANAPADIAYLLERLERAEKVVANPLLRRALETFVKEEQFDLDEWNVSGDMRDKVSAGVAEAKALLEALREYDRG